MSNVAQLLHQVTSGALPEVCLIVGSEHFMRDRAVDALRAAVVGDGPSGFNDDVFNGQGTSAQQVLSAARTLPMMAERRFVLVRRVDQMGADELEQLAGYLERPAPESCLVLTADKLDARGRFAKAAKKAGVWVDAETPKQGAMRSLAVSEAETRGHALSPQAASDLADAVGTDLAALDDALERLSLYVGEGARITEEAVAQCVAHVRAESVWALVDAISARDAATALSSCGALLADREPPLRILALVARQLRTVAKMRDALASGLRAQEAAQRAGAPPFKARELSEAAKRFDALTLARCFATLDRADTDLKGSRVAGPRVLERAVLELASG